MLHSPKEPTLLNKAPPDRVNDVLQLYHNGNLQESLGQALEVIKDYPNTPSVHNILGVIYSGLGQTDKSLHHFKETLKLDPKNANTYNNVGTVLTELGEYDEAQTLLKHAINIEFYIITSF